MGRKLGSMGYGVVVAGNEHSKVDTIKVLAKVVATSDELIGEVVGNGMLENAEAIANSPAYTEAIEVLALYLVKMVENNSTVEDEDEDDDDSCEDEDEDEDDLCERCGEVVGDNGGTIEDSAGDAYYICYDCMTANEYIYNYE